jgi:hypothetical protein
MIKRIEARMRRPTRFALVQRAVSSSARPGGPARSSGTASIASARMAGGVIALVLAACTTTPSPNSGGVAASPGAASSTEPTTAINSGASPSAAGASPAAAASSTPTVTASASPTASPFGVSRVTGSTLIYTSFRYRYSITLTSAWIVVAIPGTWDGSTDTTLPAPGTDHFSDPGVAQLIVGFMPVSAGTTAASWASQDAINIRFQGCPTQTVATPPSMIGGHQVVLVPWTCQAGSSITNAFLVDGTNGVLVEWIPPEGGPSDRPAFQRILGSLTFR